MKVNRNTLVQHLNRISCNGQIVDAVFTGTFGTKAFSPDQQLLVIAPPIPKTKVLLKKDEEMGIADLDLLIKSLAAVAGTGNEATNVELNHSKYRLEIDEGDRGVLRLLTAAPKTISTAVDEAIVKKLLKKAPPTDTDDGIPLTRVLIEGIKKTFSLFKAVDVELFVGPHGGKLRVGEDKTHIYDYPSEALKADEEYSLLFGPHLVDVLSIVTNFNEAALYLAGPDSFILVDDGGYKYILAPRAKSADA